MDPVIVSLCPSCGACPEVEVLPDQVRIGEAGNQVTLQPAEWNVLVELIQAGTLGKI